MKDITLRNTTQEKKDETPRKCFTLRGGCRARSRSGSTRRLGRPRFRHCGILGSMSVSVRALEQVHANVRAAIIHRRPIAALYRGSRRLLCPHLLGWSRERRLLVLCYQYGGDSVTGLKP